MLNITGFAINTSRLTIAFIALVIAAVWYGFKYLSRLDANRKAESKLRKREADAAARRSGAAPAPTEADAEDMVQETLRGAWNRREIGSAHGAVWHHRRIIHGCASSLAGIAIQGQEQRDLERHGLVEHPVGPGIAGEERMPIDPVFVVKPQPEPARNRLRSTLRRMNSDEDSIDHNFMFARQSRNAKRDPYRILGAYGDGRHSRLRGGCVGRGAPRV